MLRNHFELIIRCLHVTNPTILESDKKSWFYDKVGKIKWLVDEGRSKILKNYNLDDMVIIDNIILKYKDNFCPIRQ